ncbi:beta-phosphoglucomutase [Vibrio rotiferianus]|uniref:beta-phosphoglucomutase n=1 Tax=Vibrio rotiferianus TaxID=190895 RepID=UPI00406A2DDD
MELDNRIKALIFDLDGVLVDTAHFHYLAWKEVCNKYDMDISLDDNQRLKGVSRTESLDIILDINGRELKENQKEQLLVEKNQFYLSLIDTLSTSDLLPGTLELLKSGKEKGLKIGLGSASKNAKAILNRTKIVEYFDYIVDGNMVKNSKPDPEVFELCANKLLISPEYCVVFEDSIAGVNAAIAANMSSVGVGFPSEIVIADSHVPTLLNIKI